MLNAFDNINVVLPAKWRLPGILCSRCGHSSYGTDISSHDGNSDIPLADEFAFVSAESWFASRSIWARSLGVDASRLSPGIQIGRPAACAGERASYPLVHVSPTRWWCRRDVLAHLVSINAITDANFVPIAGWTNYGELVINAVAATNSSMCNECGRITVPTSDYAVRTGLIRIQSGIARMSRDRRTLLFRSDVVRAFRDYGISSSEFQKFH